MLKPNESLDDYTTTPPTEKLEVPPFPVSLTVTGEREILKPLIETPTTKFRFATPHQPLWFRRMVAVGGGAIVMIAFVLISAILVGISEPIAGPEIASDEQADQRTQMEPFDILSASISPGNVIEFLHPVAKRRVVRARAHVTPDRQPRYVRQPQPIEPKFFPTTLVIYSENGEIKTRVEPWIQSS
jgi:hypothetical protein